MYKCLLVNALLIFFSTQIASQNLIELETIATGFAVPVGIANVGDDRLFIVEKPGTIAVIDTTGDMIETPFLDIRDRVNDNGSEQGLLGLAFHPDYSNNGFCFVNYTRGDGSTVVSRFTLEENSTDQLDPDSEKEILVISQPFGNHNGGQIEFGPDGYLYIGMGDGGSGGDPGNRSQNRQLLLGKMLRIDIDNGDPYAIPPDNPFAEDDFTLDEIWSLGLRNPWRFSFDRMTGDLLIADVGQDDWEEVNFQPADSEGGQNWGWRCFEGPEEFNPNGCEEAEIYDFPIYAYPQQGFNCGGSITGGYVYRGNRNPGLQGKYIFVDYCKGVFRALDLADSTAQIIASLSTGAYTSFGEDASGEVYVCTAQGIVARVDEIISGFNAEPVIRQLSVFPVPSGEIIHLEGFEDQLSESGMHFEIVASNGALIDQSDVTWNISGETVSIYVNELTPGVYSGQLIQADKSYAFKFVVMQ